MFAYPIIPETLTMFENELQPADGKILSQILCRQLSPHVKGLVGPY